MEQVNNTGQGNYSTPSEAIQSPFLSLHPALTNLSLRIINEKCKVGLPIDKTFTNRIKKEYGMESTDYINLLKSQNWECAICKIPFKIDRGNRRDCHIDHNHKDGKVRGMLCGKCNFLLGVAKDNTNTLKNAINYIKENGANNPFSKTSKFL